MRLTAFPVAAVVTMLRSAEPPKTNSNLVVAVPVAFAVISVAVVKPTAYSTPVTSTVLLLRVALVLVRAAACIPAGTRDGDDETRRANTPPKCLK